MEVHQGVFVDSVAFAAEFAAVRPEYTAVPLEPLPKLPEFAASATDARLFSDCAVAGRMNGDEQEDFIYAESLKIDAEVCGSCELPVLERTLLSANGRSYHEQCLRCMVCAVSLQNQQTCYQRDGNIFCKTCYIRQFGTKCESCERVIQPTDWVRRARERVFHLACFACEQCKRQLSTGEEFALQDCRLLCKQHYVELIEGDSGIGLQKQKTKRVRTTFAEEQISVLQAHFQIDSNPDGADLERIANMTGLSKRVTQVWFQNSRARQKKYQGGRKGGDGTEGGRSSEDLGSPGPKSDNSSDGMMYPTSVTTSAEEAMSESTIALSSLQYE